ncbi:tripartite motif-containing protein 16 [Osmerus mordax]|uniref:tripartite motif-containing protein 16 n=1 Tax=Osmerus mordax TaxID=8014 RepID=UPI00351051D9
MPNTTPTTNGVPLGARKAGRKTKTAPAEKPPMYEPGIPEPTTRAELMKYWLPLTLDDKTAQKLLWLSEGGSKVSRMSEEVCPYPNRPERYEHSPQVLCKEGVLQARGYWEVDYEGWVVIGATYESVCHKGLTGPCGLGENATSWGVGWAGSCYHVWHDSTNVEVQLPQCRTLGVYADQPAGVLRFYLVEGDGEREVRPLHRFKTTLKEKIMPGFWIGTNSSCSIRKKDC